MQAIGWGPRRSDGEEVVRSFGRFGQEKTMENPTCISLLPRIRWWMEAEILGSTIQVFQPNFHIRLGRWFGEGPNMIKQWGPSVEMKLPYRMRSGGPPMVIWVIDGKWSDNWLPLSRWRKTGDNFPFVAWVNLDHSWSHSVRSTQTMLPADSEYDPLSPKLIPHS